MKRRTQIAVAGATVLALGGVGIGLGTGAVQAGGVGGGDDDAQEQPITGSAYDEAEQAALQHVGEGRVTGTEVDDEEGAYEVEVTRDDGSEVDVHLDADFAVIGTEDDSAEDADDD